MHHIQIINDLIRYNHYRSYLEIGVEHKHCFDNIVCDKKISVDPAHNDQIYDYNMSSDDFFKINKDFFDIIFIDGLHLAEQVDKDIYNSLLWLNPNGTIIIHDTNPPSENCTCESYNYGVWCGTVWKSIFNLRKTRPDLVIETYPEDFGVTLIKRGSSSIIDIDNPYYSYKIFDKYRSKILNFKK